MTFNLFKKFKTGVVNKQIDRLQKVNDILAPYKGQDDELPLSLSDNFTNEQLEDFFQNEQYNDLPAETRTNIFQTMRGVSYIITQLSAIRANASQGASMARASASSIAKVFIPGFSKRAVNNLQNKIYNTSVDLQYGFDYPINNIHKFFATDEFISNGDTKSLAKQVLYANNTISNKDSAYSTSMFRIAWLKYYYPAIQKKLIFINQRLANYITKEQLQTTRTKNPNQSIATLLKSNGNNPKDIISKLFPYAESYWTNSKDPKLQKNDLFHFEDIQDKNDQYDAHFRGSDSQGWVVDYDKDMQTAKALIDHDLFDADLLSLMNLYNDGEKPQSSVSDPGAKGWIKNMILKQEEKEQKRNTELEQEKDRRKGFNK